MTRLLPYPLLSAALLLLWLLANQTVRPGQILLGAAVALVGGWALTALQPPKARLRRPAAALRLGGRVLVDIIRSNIAVGRIVLGLNGRRERRSGFIDIPLELRDQKGLAALACIITSTPGTLWVNFDPARGTLMIHVLDLIDEEEWARTIKGRYETLLLEIFQ
ncbi:Na+/H+ antiporter subunit E [Hansschlegelia beijingensis]|uniref:Multicomponent K+:H+ antiporter subunit E n=1 Tax=Hansschlegelia beijingensis TaxID=1133344 RepID=A0A7W6D6U2_9HYPH|nr:Na+/H+ antiporter subunit E [Hansschlegelia beijingensis]MBB3974218.1 multicomponent K+:H+ antiporter subunit E [Hansschlegelia beijingensis]